MRSSRDPEKRFDTRWRLVRELYRHGYSAEEVRAARDAAALGRETLQRWVLDDGGSLALGTGAWQQNVEIDQMLELGIAEGRGYRFDAEGKTLV